MRGIRTSIALIVFLLICIGIVMIYSASGVYAMQILGDKLHFLKRHLLFLCIGSVAMASVMAIDYRILSRHAKPLLIVAFIMLLLVLIPGIGKESYGARRWFSLGPMNFQPAEYAKLAVLVYVADFLSRKQNRIRNFKEGFLPILLVLGLIAVLILKQPDLGSVLLISAVVFIMLFIAGARLVHIGSLFVMALPAFYFLVYQVPYRWKRISVFLDPWKDSQGSGFQLTQSQIALGSGGIFGVGLGESLQKLFYLPAAHTDFILSIIGEELGFAGAFVIIVLFICLIWQGARIAKRTTDAFGYFLAIGLVAIIGLQAIINIGVSIGALPTKGLTLPFVSYGGSGLVFNMISIGLLLNISRIQDLQT